VSLSSINASISTLTLLGRELIPTADRAWRPFSLPPEQADRSQAFFCCRELPPAPNSVQPRIMISPAPRDPESLHGIFREWQARRCLSKNFKSDCLFDPLNRACKRGLRNVERQGGSHETAVFSDSHNVFHGELSEGRRVPSSALPVAHPIATAICARIGASMIGGHFWIEGGACALPLLASSPHNRRACSVQLH
jgi:hypothetical protein